MRAVVSHLDHPQSLFDLYLKNFTAKLDWLFTTHFVEDDNGKDDDHDTDWCDFVTGVRLLKTRLTERRWKRTIPL